MKEFSLLHLAKAHNPLQYSNITIKQLVLYGHQYLSLCCVIMSITQPHNNLSAITLALYLTCYSPLFQRFMHLSHREDNHYQSTLICAPTASSCVHPDQFAPVSNVRTLLPVLCNHELTHITSHKNCRMRCIQLEDSCVHFLTCSSSLVIYV